MAAPIGAFSARDEFDQSAGAATGKTLPIGGTWGGAGDADDFSIGSGALTRAAASDSAGIQSGRLLTASGTSALTNCAVAVTLSPQTVSGMRQGLLARYTDASNFLAVYYENNTLYAVQRVAGTTTTLDSTSAYGGGTNLYVEVTSNGTFTVTLADATLTGYSAALVTGGALASGKVGIVDCNTSVMATTRTYDDFFAYVVVTDAAVFASQSLEITHNQARREDSAGVQFQPVGSFYGDYLKIPCSGMEGRPVRIFVKASRGVPLEGADSATDDISARLYYTPRYLVVPE